MKVVYFDFISDFEREFAGAVRPKSLNGLELSDAAKVRQKPHREPEIERVLGRMHTPKPDAMVVTAQRDRVYFGLGDQPTEQGGERFIGHGSGVGKRPPTGQIATLPECHLGFSQA